MLGFAVAQPCCLSLSFYVSPSVCSLDPEQKDQLIEVIEKLLADKTTVSILGGITQFSTIGKKKTHITCLYEHVFMGYCVAGSRQCGDGIWGSVSGADWPHP